MQVTKPSEAVTIVSTLDCATHRFEATIELTDPDVKPRAKAVRKCGETGESNVD